ncbi:trehalose-phosphatase [Streptomyces sp. 3MP-14]|uniref:Trehalose 6-phosphate phosphatase n=1 Tax=Streptomyces mimosae TaxID=2586635 RepID=A0A5N5ZQP9_9ACTN|nr:MULTISPECIES: trehalose-phosphatase [Streptomyces]KAB8158837.1 trehalose-phosphatase [Streptomyces mimosae]KAB8172739.1 trehalose-phosphatase [Streptomyces sp. 3MP-14]
MGSLPQPTTQAGRAGLAALLDQPARALIALDFDGTVAPIVADPEQARAHPDAVPALARLAGRVAVIAVITGRPAEVAVRLGGFAGHPELSGLIVLGAYGAERWDAATGELRTPPPHPGVAAARAELPELTAPTGAFIEDKGNALAVHTRRAADPQGAFETLREPLARLAERHGLHLEPGRLVLELRPGGMDKGVALTALARETGAGSVLYAGDDLGDLPAFAAVADLAAAGIPGLRVCSGSTEVTALAEATDLTVQGPEGLAALLTALADQLA